jgi:hypothetical protein
MAYKLRADICYDRTYRTFGNVVLPPSHFRPNRSLDVVALRRVNDGAALLQTKSRADARRLRNIFEADNLHDRYS